jgi:aminoglycoside/choline kinase family phosphotransferase
MTPEAFRRAYGTLPGRPIGSTLMAGDGSDRRWYRLEADRQCLIMADHGIRPSAGETVEVDATIDLGRHLWRAGLAVPRIHLSDRFCGLVFFQDLGDMHLQHYVQRSENPRAVAAAYERLVRLLVRLSQEGAVGFDPSWAWQTPFYDREVIFEKECRYFVSAYVQGHLGLEVKADELDGEFRYLADRISADGVIGFMHRDLQSRNVMIHEGKFSFIDYQGGRMGPIQYDLASLLIDPYVDLPDSLREHLLGQCMQELERFRPVDPVGFRRGFDYCSISRNLQMLGAFGFLTTRKNKPHFKAYIPSALRTLRCKLHRLADPGLARLKALVDDIGGPVGPCAG